MTNTDSEDISTQKMVRYEKTFRTLTVKSFSSHQSDYEEISEEAGDEVQSMITTQSMTKRENKTLRE